MTLLAGMEPVDAGFLSLVPPLTALVLAFVTKEVISSLLLGVFSGTIIYTILKRLPWFNAVSIVITLLVEKMSDGNGNDYLHHSVGRSVIVMKVRVVLAPTENGPLSVCARERGPSLAASSCPFCSLWMTTSIVSPRVRS